MKNQINVYWSRVSVPLSLSKDLLTYPPFFIYENLKSSLKKDVSSPLFGYIKCPASFNELRNTIGVKADQDYNISFKKEDNKELLQLNHDGYISLRSIEQKLFDILSNYIFFSDQPLEISLLPAYLDPNNITKNTTLLSGKYDCGKWFRPINPAYISHKDIINIKRGDTLYYLKFNTNKKINLINYQFNNQLGHYMNSGMGVKNFKKFLPLKTLYNLFLEKKYNSRILKEIKNNLTGY
jgi:hypothetical protein